MEEKNRTILYLAREKEGTKQARRALLFWAADDYAGALGIPKRRWEMGYHGYGKPFFCNAREMFFSISHSGGLWGCAFSDGPVGLDIQLCRDCDPVSIAGRFFHPSEAAAVQKDPSRFFPIWTAKESYIKYLGRGFRENLSAFSVVEGAGIKPEIRGAVLQEMDLAAGYCACLCTEGQKTVAYQWREG